MDPAIFSSIQAIIQILLDLSTPDLSPVCDFKKNMKKLDTELKLVRDYLEDTDKLEVTDYAIKHLLNKLRDANCDAVHVMDEINYENMRHKVEIQNQTWIKRCLNIFYFTPPLAFRWRMAGRIKDINKCYKMFEEKAKTYCLVERVAKYALMVPPAKETDSITVDPIVIGRQNDVGKILDLITNTNGEISVLPIVGMPGIGKTTLARSVFNHLSTKSHFDERIWVCLSKNFDVTNFFKRIMECLGDTCVADNREATVKRLEQKLEGKKYLLVLDDFWNDNKPAWDDFKNTMAGVNPSKGNVIMVTTRDLKVASIVNTYRDPHSLKLLTDDDCLSIIKFGNKEVLEGSEEDAKKTACECRGLPLAANMASGTLQGKEVEIGLSNPGANQTYVMQVLKVSYDRLSSPSLKKCFALCSLFPKDSEIEREDLIQLWMADHGENNMETSEENNMEALGNTYFNILLQKSLLQEAVKDEYGNIINCKMHFLMHDLAVELLEKETQAKASHLTTLFSGSSLHEALKFKNLYRLKLCGAGIEVLPSAIGKLKHLRYLDASKNDGMKTLPGSISKLYMLQTLRITFLLRFPERLCDLINLRHLYFSSDEDFQMPRNIRKLSRLQTLPLFSVGDKEGCRIEELGFLKNLAGKLEIRNLELVNGKDEAKTAKLVGKPEIYKLSFMWTTNNDENVSEGNGNHESVLEGLQPNPNLKSLTIERFGGKSFPSWAMRMEEFLAKLIEVKFINCRKCEKIPMFGYLPLLKYLTLDGLPNVRSIGPSFYGVSSTNGGQETKVMFPSLKKIILRNMPNLTEWADAEMMPVAETRTCRELNQPCLEVLKIENCPKFKSLPKGIVKSLGICPLRCNASPS